MPAIQREMRMLVSHFQLGDYIEFSWFRGEVIGLNCNQLQQIVRVCEVLIPASNRTIGSTVRVPFNLGREHARPHLRNFKHRNVSESSNLKSSSSEKDYNLQREGNGES